MSTEPQGGDSGAEATGSAGGGIERGTYEVIRDRLMGYGQDLAKRAGTLNEQRLEIFGGQKTFVLGQSRIRTENNCVPRDIVGVGDRLLFGYNVFIGLKTETRVSDVFMLKRLVRDGDGYKYSLVGDDDPSNFIVDPKFVEHFGELYRYYKHARLITLRRWEAKLLAVFQIGDSLSDIKVFRWAIDAQDGVTYIDNRGDDDHRYPRTHDFEWEDTAREMHVPGLHPHINIENQCFVETIGGDLTIKVEDNTESGYGIYAEPVDDPRQALDDAQIQYARVGSLILLKILPYREESWRYLIFNTLTQTAARVDHIGPSCVQLPEDHGLIYPGGFYLQRGQTKSFGGDVVGMRFEKLVRSPNGEDVLYVFHREVDGHYALLTYNLIRKEVETPIHCHGFSLFPDGKLIIFRSASEEPTRVHPTQIWQTPFVSDDVAAAAPSGDTPLEKIGNAELVRGISECLSLKRLIDDQQPSLPKYEELIASTSRTIDSYFWLKDPELGALLEPLEHVLSTSELIVDEFEKVRALQRQSAEALSAVETDLAELFRGLRPDYWKSIDDFVKALADLRKGRGRLITMREMRYVNLPRIDELEQQCVEKFDQVSDRSVGFLLEDQALAPYHTQIAQIEAKVDGLAKVTDTAPVSEALEGVASGLSLLTEVVTGLQIDDATVRTRILEDISEVLSSVNRTRALLAARRKELLEKEGVAEFGAQFALYAQSVSSALALADSPEGCDDQLSRLMLQLEDLEGRFSEFDQFLEKLAVKREEVYEAFGKKKQLLMDQRQRRAQNMMRAAERILTGVQRRAASFSELAELNAWFAADAMVHKVRDLAEGLRELGDSVKADELDSRLKSNREDAVRSLRDRKDIFEDGASVIRLGKHRFSVNTQPLELTMVPRDGEMVLHLSGTGFYEALDDAEFEATRRFWDQELVSEDKHVYRGEYLAATILRAAEAGTDGLSVTRLHEAQLSEGGLLPIVREQAATRYDEGYERGVHDTDAALILEKLLAMVSTAGLLRYAPAPRAAATVFWGYWEDDERTPVLTRCRSLGRLRQAFDNGAAQAAMQAELGDRIGAFHEAAGIPLSRADAQIGGAYLFEQLAESAERMVAGAEAAALVKGLDTALGLTSAVSELEGELADLADLRDRFQLTRAWLTGFAATSRQDGDPVAEHAVTEATAILLTRGRLSHEVSSSLAELAIEGLLGQHVRISGRKLTLRLDEFLARTTRFIDEQAPGFRGYQKARHALLERRKEALRLHEFVPRVLSSFVRNKLINDVYLPIFGDNLAKQLGALGAGKRTDLMGLLLLISPPGYGKTTLMEYIANRLGLVFMKINGPALGHDVHSLDPDEAPNATARQEVQKLNLALEMGNNVLLYLDDIQHTHPEFLQKFISLCDAQRKIEGVWKGRTRTYDLRGKKFVVCMAGNPYTESGDKFQIPDMLANRADVYNLGDILGGKTNDFALSYIENALTSNPILAQVTTHDHGDIYKLVRMAQGEEVAISELSYGYSQVQVEELLSVLKKLIRCQEVILAVNQQYIESASMDDSYRTEPPFKLQGSYRNMNKLAEKLVPVMNDEELEQLLDDHYVGEAQTLTTGAEQNLLKLAELRDHMSAEQSARWAQIKETFARRVAMGGKDDDPVARVTGQLHELQKSLGTIGAAIGDAARTAATREESTRSTDAAKAQALAKRDAAVGRELSGSMSAILTKMDAATEALSKARVDVEVVNRTPEGLAALIDKQVDVIEAGLLPVVRSMGHTLKASNSMWATLEDILAQLKSLDRATLAEPRSVKRTIKPMGDKPETRED